LESTLSNVTYLRPQLPNAVIEQAAEAIRSRIVSGELELGEPLSETSLAVKLGVSKAPIREAFLRLKAEGLIEIKPQRGTFVFDMSAEEVRDLCELREVLEIAAARSAIRRRPTALADALEEIVAAMQEALKSADLVQYRAMDDAYHKRIVEHAGNAFLRSSYETLTFRIQVVRNRLTLDPVRNRRSMREHREFAALVRAGEIYRASTCLSDHIRRGGAHYLRVAGLEE
jgi:DNA-binding GntR family transcriptional regulator